MFKVHKLPNFNLTNSLTCSDRIESEKTSYSFWNKMSFLEISYDIQERLLKDIIYMY